LILLDFFKYLYITCSIPPKWGKLVLSRINRKEQVICHKLLATC
jgi:hypothetical protein